MTVPTPYWMCLVVALPLQLLVPASIAADGRQVETRESAIRLNETQRIVWQSVEARWRTWQAGDLEKMLVLYHPKFQAWNRVTGLLDDHGSLLTRWRAALQSESILHVTLEPVAVEVQGDFASAFYVSRETVQRIPAAGAPSVVSIRWGDYLVRDHGRWLFMGYAGTPCSDSEPGASVCNERRK